MRKKNHDCLAAWLLDQRAAEYFGKSWGLRFDILAYLKHKEGNLSDIARRHGVSRQAAAKCAARARKIFSDSDNPELTSPL